MVRLRSHDRPAKKQRVSDNEYCTDDPAYGRRGEIQSLLDTLFNRILKHLADTDWFTHTQSPNIFLAYAHDNKGVGEGNAASAKQLIAWLKAIQSRILSDRSPLPRLPWESRDVGNAALHDVVSNQMCLLPKRDEDSNQGKITNADKVIICCSELLQLYYSDPWTRAYIAGLKEVYDRGRSNDAEFEAKVQSYVALHRSSAKFHHVLTELAFLEIRYSREKNVENIVPVVFSGDGTRYIPYFDKRHTVWLKPDRDDPEIQPCQVLHKLFFKVIRRIYEGYFAGIEEFEMSYAACLRALALPNLPSRSDFNALIDSEVHKAYERLLSSAASLNRAVPHGRQSAHPSTHFKPKGIFSNGRESTEILMGEKATSAVEISQLRSSEEEEERTFEDRLNQLHISMRYHGMNERRSQVSPAHTGTFEWIFDENTVHAWSNFAKWLKSDGQLYWISGKAGSGKSSLIKFIMNDPRSLQALAKQPSKLPVTILSAYLWAAGTSMQSSLKGMLLSILQQLVNSCDFLIEKLLSNPIVCAKTSPEDWDIQELEAALIHALRTVLNARAICIFIDGLDEISKSEGPFEILRLVKSLQSLPKLKLCLSSRPEYIYQVSFSKYPRLRVQDLTQSDICKYVKDKLESASKLVSKVGAPYQSGSIEGLIDKVARKASGVFLWVHLVVKTLQRGIVHGDEWSTLLERLDMLPDDLYQLYNEMWSRINEDEPYYRNEAAMYFKALLNTNSDGSATYIRKYKMLRFSGTLFGLTVQASDSIPKTFLEDDTPMPDEILVQMCKDMQSKVETRCAGLIGFSFGEDASCNLSRPNICDSTTCYAPYLRYNVVTTDTATWPFDARHFLDLASNGLKLSFFHRTAEDFLLTTPEGRTILSCDSTPPGAFFMKCLETNLVHLVWSHGSADMNDYLQFFYPNANGRSYAYNVSTSHQQYLLRTYEKLFNLGYLTWLYEPSIPGGFHALYHKDFFGVTGEATLSSFAEARLGELISSSASWVGLDEPDEGLDLEDKQVAQNEDLSNPLPVLWLRGFEGNYKSTTIGMLGHPL